MKSVNESLVRRLAYEERLCLYRFAHDKNGRGPSDLESKELFDMLEMVERLTEINLTAKDFNFENVTVLGLENCCDYFAALCEQYQALKNSEDEFSEYTAHEIHFDVTVGNRALFSREIKSNIGLYDASKKVEEIIQDNFEELKNGLMAHNPDDEVLKYAIISSFADTYYSLRDMIEGKSYQDGEFMTEYRELPDEYEKSSYGLLSKVAQSKEISVEAVKKQMLDKLNKGISALAKTNMSVKEETKPHTI